MDGDKKNEDLSRELCEFLELVKLNEKMAAMLAPSFVVDFNYPDIIGKLRRVGFSYVVEVSAGAAETNRQVIDKLKIDPSSRYIMSPCPSVVRLIRNKYPDLIKYLAMTDTPMSATARIVREKFPGVRPVFIGPCVSKKLEAREDYSSLNILVLTYKELMKAFEILGVIDAASDRNGQFDIVEDATRIYPLGGGLSTSARLTDFLSSDEILETSGYFNLPKALEDFSNNPKIRVLDILFCDGGCINGPGVVSRDDLVERKKRVLAYAKWENVDKNCRGVGDSFVEAK